MQSWNQRILQLFPVSVSFIACFFILQVYFLLATSSNDLFLALISSFINIVVGVSSLTLILSFLLKFFSENVGFWVQKIYFFVLLLGLIGTLICDQYLIITHDRLDEALFLFEWQEIWMIADPTNRLNFTLVLLILLLLALPFVFSRLFKRLNPSLTSIWIFIGVFFIAYFIPFNTKTNRINENRFLFFVFQSTHHFLNPPSDEFVSLKDFQQLDAAFYGGHSNSDPRYPLAHLLEEESVLKKYLKKTSHHKIPDIKIIIVESMSSDLFGQRGENTGTLMPFLDSLSQKSLYFPNGFSTYQRTHNVLPAVLASVPNTIDGNVFQQLPFPRHYSLFNLLNREYFTQFYCGVPMSYLNMVGLMGHYRTDYQIKHWRKQHVKHKKEIGNAWGFPDEDLFQQAQADDSMRFSKNRRAALKVFLTISSHDPFIYPNKSKWENFVKSRAETIKNPRLKDMVLTQAGSFGSFSYVDSCLEAFFLTEALSPKFKNTLYIITGDHGTELYRRNALSKYNVPVLIFSPLLKKPVTSQAIVSHNDIAPTLINYLKKAYRLNLPDTLSFVGKELKIQRNFQSERKLVFTTNKLKTTDLLSGNKAFIGGNCYQLNPTLDLAIDRSCKAQWFKKQLANYQAFSRFTLVQNNLVDSHSYTRWVGVPLLFDLNKHISFRRFTAKLPMTYVGSYPIKKNQRTLRLEVTGKQWMQSEKDLKNVPNLVIQSKKTRYLSKKWTINRFIKPRIKGTFQRNKWNPLIYTLEFNPNELLIWKKGGGMHVYFQNLAHNALYFKELNLNVFQQRRASKP